MKLLILTAWRAETRSPFRCRNTFQADIMMILQRPQGEPDSLWLLCLQPRSSWLQSQSQSSRPERKMTQSLAIVDKSTYGEPTNPLFIKLKTLTRKDSVDLQTIQIIHKANQHQLPHGIQKLFQTRENKHDLRGIFLLKKKTHTKTQCTSVKEFCGICGTAVGKI